MAEGDIGVVIDSQDFGAMYPYNIIPWSGNIYVVVYYTGALVGTISTVQIDSDGSIGGAFTDTLQFDLVRGVYGHIIQVSSGVAAIAYQGPGATGWLVTVSIDAAGNIGGAVLDSFEFTGDTIEYPRIVHVLGDTYAIVYVGPGADGWLVTVSIDAAGNIGALDSLEFDGTRGYLPYILPITGSIMAIVYGGTLASEGTVITLSVAGDGTIGAIIDTEKFYDAVDQIREPSITHIQGDIYAISYNLATAAAPGYICTVEIDSAGNISAVIETLELSVLGKAEYLSVLPVSGDVCLTAFRGDDGVGGDDDYMKTLPIDNVGDIGAVIDSEMMVLAAPAFCDRDSLVYIGDQVYAQWIQAGTNGLLFTFDVETTVAAPAGQGASMADTLVKAAII